MRALWCALLLVACREPTLVVEVEYSRVNVYNESSRELWRDLTCRINQIAALAPCRLNYNVTLWDHLERHPGYLQRESGAPAMFQIEYADDFMATTWTHEIFQHLVPHECAEFGWNTEHREPFGDAYERMNRAAMYAEPCEVSERDE